MSKPGTQAGVSETVLEMAAESIDPALWAAMQLTKPDQPPPATVGDAHDRIKAIMGQTIGRWMVPQIEKMVESKQMPRLLPGLTG